MGVTAGVAACPPAAVRQRAELAGYRALWRAAPAVLAERHGIAAIEVAGGLCMAVASQAGSPMLNHAVGVGVTVPASDADLDRIAAFYAGLGTPYSIAVAPGVSGDLAERLAGRGLRPVRPWMTFHRQAGPIASPDTRLRLVEAGAASARAFGGIVAAAFEMPPELGAWMAGIVGLPGWTCLLAMDGRVPVGAAAVVVDDDCAWFTLGATLAEHRGKGAQGALFAERARRAVTQGARHLVTETGAPMGDEAPGPSYRNMLRSGFAEVELRPNYSSSGA